MQYSKDLDESHNAFDIRYMSDKYQCSLRTLRFYEERGLLSPIRIRDRRVYSHRDEINLRLIQHGKRLGLSLNEIGALICSKNSKNSTGRRQNDNAVLLLSREQIADQILVLTERRDEIDAAIVELRSVQQDKLACP